MQKFKLRWMALLRNDEHAQLIEQLCGILDDRPVENPSVRNESGRKGKIAPSRPALCRIGIPKARTDGHAEGVVGKRRRTLISLDMRVKAVLWSPLREESEPAEVLRFWLDKQSMQGGRDERGNLKKQYTQSMQGSREKQDTQNPLLDVAET